jgi:hypothetical protein
MMRVMWVLVTCGLILGLLAGCGGGGAAGEVGPTTGSIAGHIFQTAGTTTSQNVCRLIVLATGQAPSGFVPAQGALVVVLGVAGAKTNTDANGYYVIPGLPPGVYTVQVIVWGCQTLQFTVRVVGGKTTFGGGHSEGGGGAT